MNRREVNYAIALCVALTTAAGCGGHASQSMGDLASMPRAATAQGSSWIARNASQGDLLYVGQPDDGAVTIYSFPQGQVVGQLLGLGYVNNLCSDDRGDVWIMASLSSYGSRLYEYAHGGRRITTLIDSLGEGWACGVDPTTGDLAVANEVGGDYRSNVAIYANGSGVPAQYAMPDVDWPFSATYDNVGDLFVGGQVSVYDAGTDWLPRGTYEFKRFKARPNTRTHVGAQWGDKQLTEIAHPELIHRYSIANGKASFLGSMTLDVSRIRNFVVHQRYLIASGGSSIYVFNFPDGGSPTETFAPNYYVSGIALSVRRN
jgi:hypothetical protein